jgi:hypothetical protein
MWIATDVTSRQGFGFKVLRTGLGRRECLLIGASSGLGDGESDNYASCDGDDVTFSFHSCLVCGLDLGGIDSSLVGALGSSLSHSFHRG